MTRPHYAIASLAPRKCVCGHAQALHWYYGCDGASCCYEHEQASPPRPQHPRLPARRHHRLCVARAERRSLLGSPGPTGGHRVDPRAAGDSRRLSYSNCRMSDWTAAT